MGTLPLRQTGTVEGPQRVETGPWVSDRPGNDHALKTIILCLTHDCNMLALCSLHFFKWITPEQKMSSLLFAVFRVKNSGNLAVILLFLLCETRGILRQTRIFSLFFWE
jgi:hypothetical protein